ncbi:16S rRNA (cytosine(967)-C(5))-methyltransferase RsmB [Anaerostipes sp.]|uniref:16S rRNA (cytosine(967)-C(5))-methyltransferase RsmB n=1 Tax=Anaerostipes sp. TaxID=1872530 RepID=UPI0025C44828|nr:16S rRNA (cytosine(967)-C(5))-methyltransferase RsmB [Anaerostipes sp.]MBS7007843.1 16S rRNA (cytosine(967)-C(5))-methyltransferase RsmB [Anaerostipes sp.]
MQNPRESALDVLMKVDKKESLSHIVIGETLEKYQFSEKKDRAFFTRLCQGTLERQLTIDYVLNQYSKMKVNKLKPLVRSLLRMGVYQILFMDQIPDSAACNECVKLAKKRGFSKLSGFVNGVLRTISRQKDSIPFPSREKEPVRYLSVSCSMPEWIVRHFLQNYTEQETETILRSFLEPKKTTLSWLESSGSREELVASLEKEGITVRDGDLLPEALYISHYDFLKRLSSFREGRFIVQDESSMLAGKIADVKEGQIILDMCSAPGGKALYMADKLHGTGQVLARDLTEYKEELLEENIERTGFQNIRSQIWDARILDEDMEDAADIVLCDVPCSGLGIMGKKHDIKYNLEEKVLEELVFLQREILKTAVSYVKPGGSLVFSTCTINPKENEENFQWLAGQPGFEPEDITSLLPEQLNIETSKEGYIQLLPGIHPCDGFFIGKLRRVK